MIESFLSEYGAPEVYPIWSRRSLGRRLQTGGW
jgi:hypothetical protein